MTDGTVIIGRLIGSLAQAVGESGSYDKVLDALRQKVASMEEELSAGEFKTLFNMVNQFDRDARQHRPHSEQAADSLG